MKSIRYGLIAVAMCGFLLTLAGGAVVFGVERANRLADRQEFVGDQIFAAREVFETLADMETSQRGYLLTQDRSYLAPYLHGVDDLQNALSRLLSVYREDQGEHEEIAEIANLARAKRDELAQTIALAGSGRAAEALAVVRGNSGNDLMAHLRGKLLDLVAAKRAVRTGFIDSARETLRWLYLLGAGIAALIMVVVMVAVRSLSVSITHLDAAQKKDEHNAMHDLLTGLPNRRYLTEWLETALAGARRAGRELRVLYLDLDGFKGVNDRFGHEAGDRVLQTTAARLRETLRTSDFIARLGGDEFVAALPDTGDPPDVPALIARIEEALGAAPIPELKDGAVTASIGVACYPQDGVNAASVLAAADRAMYEIKMRRHEARRARRPGEAAPAIGQHQPA